MQSYCGFIQCYGLSRVEFLSIFSYIDIDMDIQCSTPINIIIQVASWRNGIRRLSSVQEDPGSNPTVGKKFSF